MRHRQASMLRRHLLRPGALRPCRWVAEASGPEAREFAALFAPELCFAAGLLANLDFPEAQPGVALCLERQALVAPERRSRAAVPAAARPRYSRISKKSLLLARLCRSSQFLLRSLGCDRQFHSCLRLHLLGDRFRRERECRRLHGKARKFLKQPVHASKFQHRSCFRRYSRELK